MGDVAIGARVRRIKEDGDVTRFWGWAALSTDTEGKPVVDAEGDWIPVDELERAVQRAHLKRSGQGAVGSNHLSYGRADITESFVLTEDKQEAFGVEGLPQGWMVGGATTDPEVSEALRSGAMPELSIRAWGHRTPVQIRTDDGGTREVNIVTDLELQDVELLSVVDRGTSGNADVRPRIVLIKGEKTMAETPRTLATILAELLEAGKLSDLPAEDKEILVAAAAQTSAPAPAAAEQLPMPGTEEVSKPGHMDDDMKKQEDEKKKEEMAKRDELAKRNVELEKRLSELEAQAAHSSLCELAKRDMAFLPGAGIEDIARLLHAARSNLGKSEIERLETILKSASAAIQQGGLIEMAGARESIEKGGKGSLKHLATEIRKERPELSMSSAYLEAARARPDLWASAKR